jgi:hypothetical protein
VVLSSGCSDSAVKISAQDVESLAKDAYVYGFPMVMNYKTMWNYVVDEDSPEYKGAFNEVSCEARLYTPEDKAIVTPNADTPYCIFWMDLRAEPQILSVPEIEDERYYSFQLIDLYTHNYAYVGTLTTGNEAGRYLLAGPGWDGDKPAGITDVIRSETDFIINITRTQLFGPDDLARVADLQRQYQLQPLSTFLGEQAPPASALPDFPKWIEGAQFDQRFFTYLDFMMTVLGKPGPGEEALWQNLARLGIGTEADFDLSALPAETQAALKAGVNDGIAAIEAFLAENVSDPLSSGKVFGTREFLQQSAETNYSLNRPDLLRSVAASQGLYGNSADEASYPTYLTDADGEPLNTAKHNYTLTFPQGALPPVKAFWSLSMYDGKTQLFIHNPLDRYLLSSNDLDQLVRQEDGTLQLLISKDSPGGALEANWLPAPDGPFYAVLRLYGPEKGVQEGQWTAPPIEKTDPLR